MENTPTNDPYRGYGAQETPSPVYSADEMPQSTYPQQPAGTYYTPAGEGQAQQQQYGQQQHYSGQQQFSGQQQQYQQYNFQQPGGYQAPYGQGSVGDIDPSERTGMGMKARTAAVLSYLFAWVGGLIFLMLERDNRFVRFHAAQSLLFFGILSVAQWFCGYAPFLDPLRGAIGLIMFIGWIVLMVKANKGQYYKLPVIGDLAEQLANKFR